MRNSGFWISVSTLILSFCSQLVGGKGIVGSNLKLSIPNGIKPIQLVRKPQYSQGQLELTEEGVEVLTNLTAPFAVVAAVGPTRTGKSSLLGRAFLSVPDLFEIGTGVNSHTTGIWMTDRPVTLTTKKYGKLSVMFVDTEGFHGVQEKTSKTYENNLFAVAFLVSSTLIYNSQYPVDSHHIDELKGYCKTANKMYQTLDEEGVHINRNAPDLLWAVQNFNFYNLNNSGMTGDKLLGNLTDMSMLETLGMADESLENLHGMFRSKSMAPIHRPHDNDAVLANLGAHSDDELKREYMEDIRRFREKVYTAVEPMQVAGVNIDGQDFALNLERWVLYGHITVDEDEAGLHYVDKKMESHVQEVLLEFRTKADALEARIRNAGTGMTSMSAFRKALDEIENAALGKLKKRAQFWSYKLKDSPLESHLQGVIDQRGRSLVHLYTGHALKALAKFMDLRRQEVIDNLKKNVKIKPFLQMATGLGHVKKGQDPSTLDYKSLQTAVRALTRSLENSVTKEMTKFELTSDRMAKEYMEEFKRWDNAVLDLVLFTHKTVKNAASQHLACLKDQETTPGVVCRGEQVGDVPDKAVRDHAQQVMPTLKAANTTADQLFTDLLRWLVSNQKQALGPLLQGSKSDQKKAAEHEIGQIAGSLLAEVERGAFGKRVGITDLLRGDLEDHLERVMKQSLEHFNSEVENLDLEAMGDPSCNANGQTSEGHSGKVGAKDAKSKGGKKGNDVDDTLLIHCDEYRKDLEKQMNVALTLVLARQRLMVQIVLGCILVSAIYGGNKLLRNVLKSRSEAAHRAKLASKGGL